MLITFEGIDGSGKSTQAHLLEQDLQKAGHETLLVREPGGTELSEQVRALLLDNDLAIAPFAELLLFSAARAQLVTETIKPALQRGAIVLCDRFYDSTTAYQGAGRGVAERSWLQGFHRKVTGGLVPDRTYLVAVPPDVARARRTASGQSADRMESAQADFHARVADAYTALAAAEPERFVRLDGQQPIDAVHAQIRADAERLLSDRAGTPQTGAGSSEQ